MFHLAPPERSDTLDVQKPAKVGGHIAFPVNLLMWMYVGIRILSDVPLCGSHRIPFCCVLVLFILLLDEVEVDSYMNPEEAAGIICKSRSTESLMGHMIECPLSCDRLFMGNGTLDPTPVWWLRPGRRCSSVLGAWQILVPWEPNYSVALTNINILNMHFCSSQNPCWIIIFLKRFLLSQWVQPTNHESDLNQASMLNLPEMYYYNISFHSFHLMKGTYTGLVLFLSICWKAFVMSVCFCVKKAIQYLSCSAWWETVPSIVICIE